MDNTISSQQIKAAIQRAKTDQVFGEQLKKRLDTGKFDTQLSEIGLQRGAQGLTRMEVSPIEQQKAERQAQGLPVSVREDRAEPTLAGEIVRGIIKAPLKTALSVPAGVMGEKGITVKSKYLGDTSDLAKTIGDKADELSKRVRAGEMSLGEGIARVAGNAALETLDAASFIPAGVGAKAGATTATKAGKSLINAGEDIVESGLKRASGVAKDKLKNIIPTREEEIIDLITPEMSKKQLTGALAKGKGVVKRGTLFDTVEIAPGKKIMDAFDEVKDIIDPKRTATENLNKARSVIEKEAEALKARVGNQKGIFTFKQLQSKLNKAKLPIGFKREVTEYNKLKDVSNAAMKIAKQKGGKISSLLDARKEFDRLVKESFPNLYDATGKPTTTYNAVTAVRNQMNDLIEKSLPKDVGYKASLRKQSLLYDVINALDEKAAREVGAPTSRVTRKIKSVMRKNPKATTAAKVVGGLTGAGVAGGIGSAIIN